MVEAFVVRPLVWTGCSLNAVSIHIKCKHVGNCMRIEILSNMYYYVSLKLNEVCVFVGDNKILRRFLMLHLHSEYFLLSG